MRVRTLIVGGGVMGASIALHVARRSDPLTQPVLLLERSRLAAGSTGRSGAILRQHYADRELAGMARDSLREYAGFELRTGYSVGFQACGVLTLAGPADPGMLERVRHNVEWQRAMGIETRLVDAAEVRALVPGIEVSDGALGAFEEHAGVCDPNQTVASFASLARYHGATTRCGAEVLEVLVEDGRVRGVRTQSETIEAHHVVLAAGPWSRGLLATLGVSLPLQVLGPQQHFVKMLDSPTGRGMLKSRPFPEVPEPQGLPASGDLEDRFTEPAELRAHAHPVILDLEAGHYMRCEPGADRTRVGKLDYADAERLERPEELREHVSPEFQRREREALVRRLPEYSQRADLAGETGLYTITPDARPVLGPCPGVEGLFLVAGFSGHGFKLAPSIGLGLTQLLFNEPVSAFDTSFFAPTRFGDGAIEWGGKYGL